MNMIENSIAIELILKYFNVTDALLSCALNRSVEVNSTVHFFGVVPMIIIVTLKINSWKQVESINKIAVVTKL